MFFFFFFKQKTSYEMRISDWGSDVCSSDLAGPGREGRAGGVRSQPVRPHRLRDLQRGALVLVRPDRREDRQGAGRRLHPPLLPQARRSEEHTSELQSLMRISYAVFCLKKKNKKVKKKTNTIHEYITGDKS